MDTSVWFNAFPAAITVTDQHSTIIDMNERAAEMFSKDGGFQLIGQSAITCHKEPAQSKVRKLYETQSLNAYYITKNGRKQLVYQAPYFIEGKFSGIVELSLELPAEMPHFDRDNPVKKTVS